MSIIGSIYYIYLVKLRGFCVEGYYCFLVYEFMLNGLLDKWIFKKKKNNVDLVLDWEIRFNIVVGIVKGFVYLYEDCDVKIVYCDIKFENVFFDDYFEVKVLDFGLVKLMIRE